MTVAELLREAIGLDPEAIGERNLEAAVAARQAALHLGSRAAYLERLHGSAAERQALVDQVVVPETWFFREPVAFELLVGHLRRTAAPQARVLSAACATGEEPYSIVMTLLDAGFGEPQVDAVDVSPAALARARTARYGPRSERGAQVPAPYRRPGPDGSFELLAPVRERVSFQVASLTDPDVLAGTVPYPAIFCRNLLIYLTPEARVRCLASLARLLAPGGLLFAGSAEDLRRVDPRWRSTGPGEAFAFVFQEAEEARPRVVLAAPEPRRPALPARPAVPPPAPRARISRLPQARELADRGRLAEALVLCEDHLAHGPDADAFFLRALIHAASGEAERAEQDLLRTLLLDAEHCQALTHLALLHERRGDAARAAGYARRAAASRGAA